MSTLPPVEAVPAGRPAHARVRCRIAGAMLLASLCGCMVGPDFTPPQAPAVAHFVPDAANGRSFGEVGPVQRMSAQAALPAQWWKLFDSAQIDTAVAQTLAGNPTLQSAQAALEQSQDLMRAGAGVFYPQAGLGAGAARERYAPREIGSAAPPYLFSLYTLTASISYVLDIWGGSRREVESLRAQAEAQRYAEQAAYLTLTGNVVDAMIARAAYSDEIAVTHSMIESLREQAEIARTQADAGTQPYAAVLALQNQLAAQKALLPALEQKRVQAEDLLAALAGRYPADWAAPAVTLDALHLPADLPETVPAELVRRRPDILQAEAQLHAASANIGVATANMLPSITLDATGNFGAGSPAALAQKSSLFGSVAAGVSAPVFRGGSLWFQRKAALDAYRQSAAVYRQTVLAAFEQVADTLRALRNDALAADAQSQALDAATSALALTRVDYAAGTTDYLHVLTADLLCQQARLASIEAMALRYQDTVALYTALGGGWNAAAPAAGQLDASQAGPRH